MLLTQNVTLKNMNLDVYSVMGVIVNVEILVQLLSQVSLATRR